MMYYAKRDETGAIVQVGIAAELPDGFAAISETEYQAWVASLPQEPDPAPTQAEQMRADIDFLAALQGVTL